MSTLTATEMKQLRSQRQEAINRARAAIKEHNSIIKTLKSAMQAGDPEGMTIPELAQAVTMDTEPVLFYISTLKKYGQVNEGAKDGDYFRYKLTAE